MLSETRSAISDLTIACVLRSGGDFDAEYVERLRDGVAANLSLPHRFVCLSDIEVPCERVALRHGWPGWWSKLELFEQLKGPVLYFDLDTVIAGSLDEIASYPHAFSMLSDFSDERRFASGVMAWSGDWSHIAHGFALERIGNYQSAARWGDQGWIVERLGRTPDSLQRLFPGQVSSRKLGTRDRRQERVVCFHGVPRPREVGWQI
jgi:hypothetical protein